MGLRDDLRGQSVQVGAVLLFAVLVILLATYQSTVVPNDDKAAEFDHSLGAEQDLLTARNAIIDTFQTGETAPVAVRLGMTYPRHRFGVDPAPVSGSLHTDSGGTVSVTSGAGQSVDACPVSNETKVLNYSAGYNFYEPRPTLVYENTVLYADYGQDRRVMVSGQDLVSGNTVNLLALRGNYSESGIGVTDVQPKAGQFRTTPVTDPTIEVPTRLSESRWETLLQGEVDPANVTMASPGVLQLQLHGAYDVRCGLVGADSVPPGGARQDNAGVDINPAGPGDVIAEKNSATIPATVHFNNTAASPANITKARVAFAFEKNGKNISSISISDDTTAESYGSFTPGAGFTTLNPKISIGSKSYHVLRFDVSTNKGSPNSGYIVLQLQFESGGRGTYFITYG